MKDSLFELLMNFFEKSLTQLKDHRKNAAQEEETEEESEELLSVEGKTLMLKESSENAIRIFTKDEVSRLTKASYQFIMRIMQLDVIGKETMELIINQLIFSESRYITLQETKWTIRNILAEGLDNSQLAFLDLVLYQKEDKLALH